MFTWPQAAGPLVMSFSVAWYGKTEPTFADAIATVRRLLWARTVFQQPRLHGGFQKLPPVFRNYLFDIVSRAG